MVKYIKAKAPTRREIRVAEREAKRALRVGPSGLRSPRPKSPTFSRSSSRGSLNELDGNVPSVFIVRSPSPKGSPRQRGPWSRSDSPSHHRVADKQYGIPSSSCFSADRRSSPTECMRLMNSCIQVCSDNLDQMRQANQRLQQLRARSPSPSAGTSPNLKRRSQLLQRRHGCGSPLLSPSPSLQLVQNGSMVVDGQRALSYTGSEGQKSALSAATSQVIPNKVFSNASSVDASVMDNPPQCLANNRQPPRATSSVPAAAKSIVTDDLDGLGGPVDTPRFPTVRPPRLVPRRESSSNSLSSNAATVRLPNPKSVMSNHTGTAGTSSTGRSSVGRDTSNVSRQDSKGRTLSGAKISDAPPRGSSAPPPARTVAGSRVAASRPVLARSLSTSRAEALSRPESAGSNDGITRAATFASVRKSAANLHMKPSNASCSSQLPRAPGSLAASKPTSDRVNRASLSTFSAASSSSAELAKGPITRRLSPVLPSASAKPASRVSVTRPPSRPSTTREVRPPVSSDRTRSASGPLRSPASSTSRASAISGPAAGERSRAKTGPQISISPTDNDGSRQRSRSAAKVPPKTDISASRTSLLDTMNNSARADSLPGLRSARRTGPVSNATGDTTNPQGHDAARRPTRPSGAVPHRPGPPAKPSIGSVRSTPTHSDVKPVIKTPATQQSAGTKSNSSVSSAPLRTATPEQSVNASDPSNAVPRPSTRRRASRTYHMQAQNIPATASAAPPKSVTRGDGRASRATREFRAKVLSTASRADDGAQAASPKVPTRIRSMDAFDIAEVKACLFGHTPSTGPPRPYTAALRYWLEMLPGLSGLFSTKGRSVYINVEATAQVFAVRKLKDIPPVSREMTLAFLRSRPVIQPTLAFSRGFQRVVRSPILTAVASAPRSPVQTKQMPEAVEDIFLPGGPFTGAGEESMRMPPPGVQKPRQESLRRALNRLSRFGTPTRTPNSFIRPLVGGSKMDAYLAALEAQTFDLHGGPRNSVGGLGHGTHARRALVRMVKTVCRTTCRNATKLVLSPWRLLLRLLLRQ